MDLYDIKKTSCSSNTQAKLMWNIYELLLNMTDGEVEYNERPKIPLKDYSKMSRKELLTEARGKIEGKYTTLKTEVLIEKLTELQKG